MMVKHHVQNKHLVWANSLYSDTVWQTKKVLEPEYINRLRRATAEAVCHRPLTEDAQVHLRAITV
jgi:hypothetical protein